MTSPVSGARSADGGTAVSGSTARALDLAGAIVASAHDAIVAKMLDGTIRVWNHGAERLFGYAADEAIGQPISLIIPAGLEAEEAEILRRIASGEGIDHFETVRQHQSGALVSVSLTISPIRDAAGRVVGASKIARDIGERKEAERRTARAVAAEQSARAHAEAASRGKDEFLATLGHELRSPLAAIASAARVLELIGSPHEHFVQARQIIERQVQFAARVVGDVLDLARVSAGKVLLSTVRLSLADTVAQCLDVLASSGRTAHHRIVLDAESDVWVEADPVRVQQIVVNLLDNAVKFTPAGGAIHVRVRAEASEALIQVEDSGIGIPADLLPRVFDLFVQGAGAVGKASDGLGIGLPLVRSLVEMHGGSVRADSRGSGEGSVFTVRLPRVPAPESAET